MGDEPWNGEEGLGTTRRAVKFISSVLDLIVGNMMGSNEVLFGQKNHFFNLSNLYVLNSDHI